MKNTGEIPDNAEKKFQARPAPSWSLHEVIGLQPVPAYAVGFAKKSRFFTTYNVVDKRTVELKIKQYINVENEGLVN